MADICWQYLYLLLLLIGRFAIKQPIYTQGDQKVFVHLMIRLGFTVFTGHEGP
jgi:hypothetical protein